MRQLISDRGHRGIVRISSSVEFRNCLDQLETCFSQARTKKSRGVVLDHNGREKDKIDQIKAIYADCLSILNECKGKRSNITKGRSDRIENLLNRYLSPVKMPYTQEIQSSAERSSIALPSRRFLEETKTDGRVDRSFKGLSNPSETPEQPRAWLYELSRKTKAESHGESFGKQNGVELSDHANLWKSRKQTGDVVFQLGDNYQLQVHASIFKKRSVIFENMILSHYADTRKKATAENPYQISLEALCQKEGFRPSSVEYLIRCFYTKHSDILKLEGDDLLDLWRCAKYFSVDDVAQTCIDQLKNGRYDSIIELYLSAKQYHCHEIAVYVKDCIRRNPCLLNEFLDTVFEEIDEHKLHCLKTILESEIHLDEYTLVTILHSKLNAKWDTLTDGFSKRSNSEEFDLKEEQEVELFAAAVDVVCSAVRLEKIPDDILRQTICGMKIGEEPFFSGQVLLEAARTLKSDKATRYPIPHVKVSEILDRTEEAEQWENLLSPFAQPCAIDPSMSRYVLEVPFDDMESDRVYLLSDCSSNDQWGFKHAIKIDNDGNMFWNFFLDSEDSDLALLKNIHAAYRVVIIYNNKQNFIYPVREQSLHDLYEFKEENFQLIAQADFLRDCLKFNNNTIHLWFSSLVYKSEH